MRGAVSGIQKSNSDSKIVNFRDSKPTLEKIIRDTETKTFQKLDTNRLREKQFLKDFQRNKSAATGSGNGGDPVAQKFIRLADSAIRICQFDRRLQTALPNKPDFFRNQLNDIQVRAVDFLLCDDLNNQCDLENSLAAKAYVESGLILVQASKFNSLDSVMQTQTSLHSVMEVLTIQEGQFELTSKVLIKTHAVQTGDNLSIERVCYLDEND